MVGVHAPARFSLLDPQGFTDPRPLCMLYFAWLPPSVYGLELVGFWSEAPPLVSLATELVEHHQHQQQLCLANLLCASMHTKRQRRSCKASSAKPVNQAMEPSAGPMRQGRHVKRSPHNGRRFHHWPR